MPWLSPIVHWPSFAEKEISVMKRTVVFALTVLLGIVATGLLAGAQQESSNPPQAMAEVKIDNFSFGPNELKIVVGTTVTWTNRDDIPHTVVSNDGVFKSKVLDTDEKFSFTFSKAGTFPYFCSIHPKMVGKVVVQ
jgi:plastocyanin